nr:unnamed protein product [Naegleria fowleri]
MFEVTVTIIGFIIIVALLFLKTKERKSLKTSHSSSLKTPPIVSSYIPFLGCALDYLRDPISFLNRVQKEQQQSYEGLFTLKLANKYVTMISSIESVPNFPQFFYNTSEEAISFYHVFNDFFQTILPFNVIEMETFSAKSMKQLKMMQHKIIPKLEDYVEIISFHLQRFFSLEHLSKKKDLQIDNERSFIFDPMQLFTELVLLINASSIVAKELGTNEEFRERLLEVFPKMNHGLEGIALSLPSAFQVLFSNVREGRHAFLEFTKLIRDILIARDHPPNPPSQQELEQWKNAVNDFQEHEASDNPRESQQRLDVLIILSTELRNSLITAQSTQKQPQNGEEISNANGTSTLSWNEIFENYSSKFQSMCAKLLVMIYAGSTVCKSSAYTLLSVLNEKSCQVKYMKEIEKLYQEFTRTTTTISKVFKHEEELDNFSKSSCFFNTEFVLYYARHANYAESCVKETLRRFTGPLVLRKVMKPLTLKAHVLNRRMMSINHHEHGKENPPCCCCVEEVEIEYKLPMGKDHFLALSPFHYHHDEEIFPNPYEFIPERFMASSSESTDSSTTPITYRSTTKSTNSTCSSNLQPFNQGFHAFSAGKHVCLGAKIAIIQSKCIVGCVLALFGGEVASSLNNPPPTLATPLEEPDYSVIGIAKPKKPCFVKCYV